MPALALLRRGVDTSAEDNHISYSHNSAVIVVEHLVCDFDDHV